jgi:type IV pilus assembly protein PilA
VKRNSGFTLVELMVVVLVLAILMAIAIPTFLGARDRGQDRAAQSSVRNTLTAAKILYGDASPPSYAAVTAAALRTVEPQFTYVAATTASANDETVSVAVNGQSFGAAVMSDSGTCYFIRDVQDAANLAQVGTFYGRSTTVACTGSNALITSNSNRTSW